MRILVTGGAGFIGSHLADALLADGHHVTVLDDFSTGDAANVAHMTASPRFTCVIGSVCDPAVAGPLVEEADAVFHLAAAVGVRLVMERPIHTIETNMTGTEVVLRHARPRRTRVVVASTSEVYGKSAALPFREDADLVIGPSTKARWGYAVSKLLDEFLALAYWTEHQVPATVVRFFNTVGPRQSSRYGMVLPTFVRHALAGEPLVVHGDGWQTRSFTWVGDAVNGLLAVLDEPGSVGDVFNIGNPQEVSINELAQRVLAVTGSDSMVEHIAHAAAYGERFEDMARRVPDIAKLRALTGWTPQVDTDEIILRTSAYWRGLGNVETAARRAMVEAVA